MVNLLAAPPIILLEWARVGRISREKGNFLILGGTPEAKASL